MSKKKPVMSHDPLAGLNDDDATASPADAQTPPQPAGEGASAASDSDATGGDAVIMLDSVLGIAEVSDLHEQLLGHVRALTPIRIHAADIESIDAAGLQLIASAYKTAREKGLEVSLVEPSAAFVSAAQQIGLAALFDLDAGDVAA